MQEGCNQTKDGVRTQTLTKKLAITISYITLLV